MSFTVDEDGIISCFGTEFALFDLKVVQENERRRQEKWRKEEVVARRRRKNNRRIRRLKQFAIDQERNLP